MENIQLDHSHHFVKTQKYPVCFLAHNIDVPMNIGSLFRITDALGVEKVYLILGSESAGVCQDLLDVSEKTIYTHVGAKFVCKYCNGVPYSNL